MTTDNPRKPAPSLAKIAAHWATHPDWPNNRLTADPTKPQCMRCGFTPPCDTWEQAGGWMEKSHIIDHYLGGSDTDPDNLVPLCGPCNQDMNGNPASEELNGLDWVKSWPFRDRDILSMLVRVYATSHEAVPRGPGRRSVLRNLSRFAGDILATYPDPDAVLTTLTMVNRIHSEWRAEAEADAKADAKAAALLARIDRRGLPTSPKFLTWDEEAAA